MDERPEDIKALAKKYAAFIDRGVLGAEEVIASAILGERQQAASIAYRTCAATRHVSLGREAHDAIIKGLDV